MREPSTLNVLLLAQFYPPVIGGEERHVRALAHGLTARGHLVTVATLRVPGTPETEDDAGVSVVRLPGTVQRLGLLYQSERHLAAPIPDPETSIALRGLVRRLRPDVVHAHNWLIASYLPVRSRGRPLILSLHDYGQVCAKKTLIWRDRLCDGPALAKCLRCASRHYGTAKGIATVGGAWALGAANRAMVDMFLPVSSAVAQGNRLAEDGLRFEVIPNFIPDPAAQDHEVIHPELVSQLPPDGYMVYVGALARRKGVEVLLDAYRRMADGPPLVLIGYRSSDVIPALDRLPPNAFCFTDWPADAVAEAWRRASFGIVPSTWADPCPTVVLEAMAAGRAVIGSRIGGMVDLVRDGETGVLVTPGDPQQLASAMANLLSDRIGRESMGSRAAQRSAQYRSSVVVERIEKVYRTLLAERAPAVHRG